VTTIAAAPAAIPRHIKVNGHRIHLRLVQQLIWSLVAATAGAYIISALYYLIIEVHWTSSNGHTVLFLKHQWDGLFRTSWWTPARHDIRDVYEGVLATLFVKSLMANWKKAHGERVSAFRLLTSPIVIIVAALPIVIAGIWVINFGGPWLWHHTLDHRALHLSVNLPGWLDTYLSTWNWQPLLIGIIAGQVVHRLYRPVGNTVQLFFIEIGVRRARETGNVPVWVRRPITPPVIRERFAWMMDNNIPVERHGAWIRVVAPVMSLILIVLALYGAFIRLWFAKHGVPGNLF